MSEKHIRRCIELAGTNGGFVCFMFCLIRRMFVFVLYLESAVAKGNHPFGAILVHGDDVLIESENSIHTSKDPTAHAELNLTRKISDHPQIDNEMRATAILYTSTEPCIMCCGAIYWAGISAVVYSVSHAKLAEYAGKDFLCSCKEVFAKGSRAITVIGPVLEDEGAKVHAQYWSNQQKK